MRHARPDYESIQPWPIHRPHIVKAADGALIDMKGTHDRTTDEAVAAGKIGPIIPDDEPVFVLRAKDAAAPDTMRAYARIAEASGADPALIALASSWADEMERWQIANGSKAPDLAAEVPSWPHRSPTDHPDRLT
jgi:hypothetical protein